MHWNDHKTVGCLPHCSYNKDFPYENALGRIEHSSTCCGNKKSSECERDY